MSSLPSLPSPSSITRPGLPGHAELHCVSSFSFQHGASSPQELIARAHQLGYSALAITDDCSVAGVVRAYAQWKELKEDAEKQQQDFSFKLIVGSEFTVHDDEPFKLVALARHREGYGHLSEFITSLRRDSPKGTYLLRRDQVTESSLDGCTVLIVPPRPCSLEVITTLATWAQALFGDRAWLAAELFAAWDDTVWLDLLQQASQATGVPLVAASDVHFHVRSRKPLHDVMTAIRLGKPVNECGMALQPNAERHLRSRLRLARRYPAHLLQATQVIAAGCNFNLKTLGYEYPPEIVPAGRTPTEQLRHLTEAGIARLYPQGPDPKLREQIDKELLLIQELKYEKFFLTVEDVVRHAREQNILCQGRGSAANSAVCYCLGVTSVDPGRSNLLFERFLSKERDEPPDIDVDFEHQRRPEVIAYLYGKYGRHRTALAATVISYRTRSAVRDVGKALGFDTAVIDALAKSHQWWETSDSLNARLRELGLEPDDLDVRQWTTLTQQLIDKPRHLSQHVGGFVIAEKSLGWMVPIENTAMPDRSVIQWDKDDLETLGLLKVDVLALGMLSAIRRSLDFLSRFYGRKMTMQDIPSKDQATYDMICEADTVGVFQIESRAQMSMLPRLRPQCYYDLVVQVAIVRPGPIQGGMVHPFLKSRQDKRNAYYPPILEKALARTNGVPIFQEQVMQIVILGAGFTPGEADQLRRSMAAWKRKGGLDKFQHRIVEGLTLSTENRPFAERIFEMIKGFGEYGFPESHAAGFALLAYVSAWLKCHEPGTFLAGLLNAQPMGFYSPSQLVQDARRHDVTVLPADVSHSEVESTMDDRLTVRLGLQLIGG
ncbi:MAG: DNA polymerase III subunit alpha, partial [Rubrivivax sp.]